MLTAIAFQTLLNKFFIFKSDYFLQDAVKEAYRRDGQATSHPLSFPIDKAEDVSGAFDAITYNKVVFCT